MALANDCSRFVTRHFEIISTSSPHIYHTALVLTPRESIIQKMYKPHAQPFVRVVHGVPVLWDSHTAAATCPSAIDTAVWSPCNKFIAISFRDTTRAEIKVEILDSVALQRLQNLEFLPGTPLYSEVLIFSPDSRMLTSFTRGYNHQDAGGFVVSWDLQTGGVISAIGWKGSSEYKEWRSQMTYSMDGEMVAVLSRYESSTTLSIYNVVSGVHTHDVGHHASTNPDLFLGAPPVYKIWTHGKSLRFATSGQTGITIWGVGFASGATPREVERVFIPQFVSFPRRQSEITQAEFHPVSFRLAFVNDEGALLVWDVRASKLLLCHTDADTIPWLSFSSNGRFLAYPTTKSEFYLWKESLTGYTLFEKFTPSTQSPEPLPSPNGESIIAFGGPMVQLWNTKRLTTTSRVSAQALEHVRGDFVVEFLPDRLLAVAARKEGKTMTVLDLKSGVPQLTTSAKRSASVTLSAGF